MQDKDSIGLVLSGGGAKGAFQAGVWKVMNEFGLADKVRVISGTSAGAINAAAFATLKDPERICHFWRTYIGDIATPNLKNLLPDQFISAMGDIVSGRPFPFRGLLDREALERILSRLLPKVWAADAPNVYVTALECRGGLLNTLDPSCYKKQCFLMNEEINGETRVKQLLASAAIPWGFDPVDLDGKRFVDGSWDSMGGENIPITPILNHHPEIKTIIVVRCNCEADEKDEIRGNISGDINLIEIRPRNSLPGPFDLALDSFPLVDIFNSVRSKLRVWSGCLAFDSIYTKRFMKLGYDEAFAALRHIRPRMKLNW